MSKIGNISIIHSLRGVAALSVCLYHFVATTTDFVTNQAIVDTFYFGQKGVQMFFIISGIVIPLSMIKANYLFQNMGRFLLRRFIRIEPPYLLAVVLGIAYLYARNFVPSSADVDLTPSITEILLHIGYLIPLVEDTTWINPVFWTLSVEFQYYLFLAFVFPLVLSGHKLMAWAFNAIIIAMPFLLPNQEFFPAWSAYFGLGIFYVLYLTKRYSLVEYIIVSLLCSGAVLYNQSLVDFIVAVLTLLLIHFFANLKSRIGNFFGSISYSLYLIHTIIGTAFINFMSHRVEGPLPKFLVIVAGLAITIGASYLYWRWVERPSQLAAQKVRIKPKKQD